MIFDSLLPSAWVDTSTAAAVDPSAGGRKYRTLILASPDEPRRIPIDLACTVAFTMAVRFDPAAVAWVPVIVIPDRTPARTAHSSVDFTKTAQQTSRSTNVITRNGRKVNVNSRSSAPRRRRFRRDFDLSELRLLIGFVTSVLSVEKRKDCPFLLTLMPENQDFGRTVNAVLLTKVGNGNMSDRDLTVIWF